MSEREIVCVRLCVCVCVQCACVSKHTHTHTQNIAAKPFFPEVLSYMTSGPVVPMIWEGDGVVKAGRTILGATKPSGTTPPFFYFF